MQQADNAHTAPNDGEMCSLLLFLRINGGGRERRKKFPQLTRAFGRCVYAVLLCVTVSYFFVRPFFFLLGESAQYLHFFFLLLLL